MLERAGAQIGIVTGIVGARSFTLEFHGEAGHAGTTPMDERRDAGLPRPSSQRPRTRSSCATSRTPATVGDMRFAPGGVQHRPGLGALSLEFRSARRREQLDALESALVEEARAAAASTRSASTSTPVGRWEPTGSTQACERDRGSRGPARPGGRWSSVGAGHDAQALAGITPSGMIFVPSPAASATRRASAPAGRTA